MKYNVVFSNIANKDLEEILNFYSTFTNQNFLIDLVNLIYFKAESLNILPERFRIFKWKIRFFCFEKNFKMFYEINKNKKEVIILKVKLSSQDDSNFF